MVACCCVCLRLGVLMNRNEGKKEKEVFINGFQ